MLSLILHLSAVLFLLSVSQCRSSSCLFASSLALIFPPLYFLPSPSLTLTSLTFPKGPLSLPPPPFPSASAEGVRRSDVPRHPLGSHVLSSCKTFNGDATPPSGGGGERQLPFAKEELTKSKLYRHCNSPLSMLNGQLLRVWNETIGESGFTLRTEIHLQLYGSKYLFISEELDRRWENKEKTNSLDMYI